MDLNYLYQQRGPFKTCYLQWDEQIQDWRGVWIDYLQDYRKNKVNLREVLPDEIVLDVDEKDETARNVSLNNIMVALRAEKVSFQAYHTGSRGYHVHITIPELRHELYDKNDARKRVREWYINRFHTDLAKKTGLIAIEDRPHFKTGIPKTLICDFKGENNTLRQDVTDYALNTKKTLPNPSSIVLQRVVEGDVRKHPLIAHCLTSIVPDGTGRHRVWLRNIAITCKMYGLNSEEILRLGEDLRQTGFPDKNNVAQELLNWSNWVKPPFIPNKKEFTKLLPQEILNQNWW